MRAQCKPCPASGTSAGGTYSLNKLHSETILNIWARDLQTPLDAAPNQQSNIFNC